MSAAVPDGFGLVETFGVDFNRTTPTLSDAVLEQDRAYFAQVSGTGTLNPRTRRVFDAEYAALPDGTKLQDSSPSRGFDYGLQLGLDTPAPVNFGGYQSDHVYGTTFTGNNTRLAGQINDFRTQSYANNSGSLSVRVYEQVQLQSLTVADNRHEDRSASATRPAGGGTPTPGIVTLPLGKNGNAPLALSADFGADRYVSQAGLNLNNIRWELRRGGSVVDAGDYSSGTVVDLAGASTTPYELAAWYDADGSGTVNNSEEELAVQVETVQLDTLTLSSTNHRTNAVDKPITGPGEILYVELEDGAPSVPIDLGVTRLTSGPLPQNVEILWSVTGPGGNLDSQAFTSGPATANLTTGGGTYTAQTGFDLNGDGSLTADEVAIESEVVVVQIDRLYIADNANTSFSKETAALSNQPELWIYEDPTTNTARLDLDVFGSPQTSEAGSRVLWQVTGGSVVGNDQGDFGGADPTITLDPPKSNTGRSYTVEIGFDDDGDGTLDAGEVSRKATINPVLVELDIQHATRTLGEQNQYTVDVYVGGNVDASQAFTRTFGRRVDESTFTQAPHQPAGANVYDRTERVAGFFEWQGQVRIDGRWFTSVPDSGALPVVEVQFPTADQARNNAGLRTALDNLWAESLTLANSLTISELGAWIILDTSSGQYSLTATQYGGQFASDYSDPNSPSITLVDKPIDEISGAGINGSARYLVGSFHTHPAVEWLSGSAFRPVGPSSGDHRADQADNVFGLVYDYVANTAGGSGVLGGTLKSANSDLYKSGPARRATPS